MLPVWSRIVRFELRNQLPGELPNGLLECVHRRLGVRFGDDDPIGAGRQFMTESAERLADPPLDPIALNGVSQSSAGGDTEPGVPGRTQVGVQRDPPIRGAQLPGEDPAKVVAPPDARGTG